MLGLRAAFWAWQSREAVNFWAQNQPEAVFLCFQILSDDPQPSPVVFLLTTAAHEIPISLPQLEHFAPRLLLTFAWPVWKFFLVPSVLSLGLPSPQSRPCDHL